MESFIQELRAKKVLSREDIVTLKEYISKKYVNCISSQKSNMLANAIYRVIDKNIQGLGMEHNEVIKKDLLKNTILKNGEPILLLDIFNICLAVEGKSNDFLERLINWVNLNVENKVSKDEIEEYILKLNTLNNSNFTNQLTAEDDFMKIKTEKSADFKVANKFSWISENTKNFYDTLTNYTNWRAIQLLCWFFLVLIIASQNVYRSDRNFVNENIEVNIKDSTAHTMGGLKLEDVENNKEKINPNIALTMHLPQYFKYKDINQVVLRKFLSGQNSLLAEEPYFSTMISVAKEFNLNPLIIFAIAGQEQSFVPKGDLAAIKIANNPFNVYHSWKEYNTNIYDSSRIVCRTVINLSEGRPQEEDPFRWINKRYAEDQNWWKSVSRIYNKLEENENSVAR